MAWEVEFTDDFEEWWNHLSAEEQESVNASVRLLQEKGPRWAVPMSMRFRKCRSTRK